MNLKKIEQQNAKLSICLKAHRETKRELMDIVKRIEIEDAKPSLDSYMAAPRSWYKTMENNLENHLIRIENRMQSVIKNIEYYGK